jgi:hypothetical protein
MMTALRSIAAVAAGYIVFAASAALLFQLSGTDPHAPASLAFKVASIIWGIVFALIAGWLTGRIAARRQATHAAVLAALIALGALVSLILRTGHDSIWSQLAALVFLVPATWIGGVIARKDPEA